MPLPPRRHFAATDAAIFAIIRLFRCHFMITPPCHAMPPFSPPPFRHHADASCR
jgi:hypothetical protein